MALVSTLPHDVSNEPPQITASRTPTTKAHTMSKPLTPNELAHHLGIATRTVQKKARNRQWPHQRIGRLIRFNPRQVADIEAMIEREAIHHRPEVNVPNPVYQPYARVVPMRPDAA